MGRAGPSTDFTPHFISFIAPLITQVIREMGSGMKALDTKAFIPLPICLITCVMRGAMKEMKSPVGPADLDIVKNRKF